MRKKEEIMQQHENTTTQAQQGRLEVGEVEALHRAFALEVQIDIRDELTSIADSLHKLNLKNSL